MISFTKNQAVKPDPDSSEVHLLLYAAQIASWVSQHKTLDALCLILLSVYSPLKNEKQPAYDHQQRKTNHVRHSRGSTWQPECMS